LPVVVKFVFRISFKFSNETKSQSIKNNFVRKERGLNYYNAIFAHLIRFRFSGKNRLFKVKEKNRVTPPSFDYWSAAFSREKIGENTFPLKKSVFAFEKQLQNSHYLAFYLLACTLDFYLSALAITIT
jgi:hypothetical protein